MHHVSHVHHFFSLSLSLKPRFTDSFPVVSLMFIDVVFSGAENKKLTSQSWVKQLSWIFQSDFNCWYIIFETTLMECQARLKNCIHDDHRFWQTPSCCVSQYATPAYQNQNSTRQQCQVNRQTRRYPLATLIITWHNARTFHSRSFDFGPRADRYKWSLTLGNWVVHPESGVTTLLR